METEEAKHEAEESLMLGQIVTSRHRSHKFQNGARCSQEDSLQISDGESWITGAVHYDPSKAVVSMKRYRENCNVPASEQASFQPGFYKMNGDLMNGELKHGFIEESLQVHQPKKMKVDAEMKENGDSSYNLVKNFSESTKKTEMKQSSVQTDINFDIRNCHISNGDIFSRPQNKLVPNGAVSSSSTIESTSGDLLEKTLSQYYPEQVSIAPQASGSQLDTVNDSLATHSVGDGAQPPALTSGLSESQQQQPPAASAEGMNSYNSGNYLVNGYSSNFGENHHQQQPSSCSDQDIALGTQQHLSGAQCFQDNTNPQGTYTKAQQEYNPRTLLTHSTPLRTAEAARYGSVLNSGVHENSQRDKLGAGLYHDASMGLQYGTQTHNVQDNAGQQHRPDGQMGNCLQQQNHSGSGNGMENTHQQRANMSCSTPSQNNWMERNLSHSHQQPTQCPSSQAKEQDMWKDLPAKPQSEQQTTCPQVQNQILESNQAQRYRETQTQRLFTDTSQGSNSSKQKQQDCLPAHMQHASVQHNTAPEWQQSSSKAPQMQQNLLQKLPETKNFPQNQQSNCYLSPVQSEHLHEDKDLQEILSQVPTSQQQQCHIQRPLPHPPQFEAQQLKSLTYRPRSQPPPGQHQPQPDQPLVTTIKHTDQSAFTYNNTEMQQPQHQRQCHVNSGSQNLKQFQPQQPNNHCHEPNQVDLAQTSSQSQPHLPQGLLSQQSVTRVYPKAEEQVRASCTQFQPGPRLPLGPAGPHVEFQRHAALRMRLLQQERHGPPHPPQSPVDPKQNLRAVKMENGATFELPSSRQQQKPFQTHDAGMARGPNQARKSQALCVQNKKPGSISPSMEQSLRQVRLSNLFEKKPLVVSSNKVKVESSGPVTILSTNMDMSGTDSSAAAASPTVVLKKTAGLHSQKEQLLRGFIDSPMKLLDTPVKNLLDTPMKTQYEIASCHCVDQIIEKDEGPYYTHLGSAPTVVGIRELMEKRSGLTGRAIRIEKVIYSRQGGEKVHKDSPIAKWVNSFFFVEEKLLVLVRERTGHRCDTPAIIIIVIPGLGRHPASLADRLYLEHETLTNMGAHTQRRCAFNEERTCACQGFNPEASGASFSFGCSWSMYYNGCKFARSKIPRKFKLLGDDVREEENLEKSFQNLATLLAPLYKIMAPEAYGNQVEHEHRAPDCRLGIKEGRPFSGVTACLDFCAHAHRDLHNMQGGSTVVCTLTREDNREIGKIPEDEQLHVLPLYKASSTDEFGSEEGQQEKIKSGAIQVLSAFRRQVRMLAEPAKSCRQKKLDAKKAAANKNAMLESSNDKAEKAPLVKSKAGTYENTVQNSPFTGAVGAPLQSGHPSYPLGVMPQQIQQQQHQGMLPPYPSSPNTALPRFSNSPGSFPGSPKPGGMYTPQPSTPASHFLSSLPNSYMNGPNRPQLSHQCNGGMPVESYHSFYAPNQNQLDMYHQPRPALYPEQQYGVQQCFEPNYPSRYNQPGFQVNGYSAMRPPQPMRHYGPFGHSRTSDARFLDTLSGAPSVHGGMDYALAVSKGNQFGDYPSSYLPQSPHIPSHDSFHMPIKTELGMPSPQMLPAQIGSGCLNPETQSGLGLPNGGNIASSIKLEPGTPQTPTTPQKPEMWSDNEHNFLDPEIGGVAVAPSHGSVLIECAKRELHATTPLKNPDRNHPTRISLVFYQHKNLNEAKHGLAMWEAKMAEKAREKEEEAERNGGEGTPSKSGKKGVKREHSESSEIMGEPPYKRFIKALMEGSSSSFTTNTHVMTTPYAFTKVTGPYSQFV
ncbi:LOW QUALITY PROTEIN: methylcytosine dioxygenase TET2 [Anableps anableps]